MNVDHDLERRLVDLYSDEAHLQAPDRVLMAVLGTLDHANQRRRFTRASWRLPNMNLYAKLAVTAVVVIAVGAVGMALLRPFGTAPGEQPSPTPPASPSPKSTPQAASLGPVRHGLSGFPVNASLEVPDGWTGCPSSSVEQAFCKDGPAGAGVGFWSVDNVVADPCTRTLLDPPVGPGVDDLVAAISRLKGFQATTPIAITVDGYPAKQFVLTAPADPGCDLRTWLAGDRINGVGPAESNLLRIVDVDGERVMLNAAYFADTPPETRAEQQAMLDSVHLNP